MNITITQLRSNLYKIMDQIIQTGEPLEIERKGIIVKIIPEKPKNNLSNFKKHPGTIVGDPEDFVHIDWQKSFDSCKCSGKLR